MKKALAVTLAVIAVLTFAGCDSPTTKPSPSPIQTVASTDVPSPTEAPDATTAAPTEGTESPTATPEATATAEPDTTPEAPDAAGQGDLVFDIYKGWAQQDVNSDGTAEDIKFTSGADKSVLTIDGKEYDVAKPHLAQLFAITDIDTTDKIMEFVFTDEYDADLADSEKASSWLYWWDGSKLMLMGGLLDVKFAGEWRNSFKAEDVTDGKGQAFGLARTQELTDIWYVAYYRPTGSGRKLYEWRHTATPVNEVGKLKCKTVCLIQTNHDETSRDKNKYMNSEYDYYWTPTIPPTTLGRVADPEEGVKVIVKPGETLTIVGTYGPTWFKVKTEDGIVGWIYCKGGKVGGYFPITDWTAKDMFDGLVVAG